LRIGSGGPLREEVEEKKNEAAAKEAAEKIEGCRADAHGKKEEPSFGPENGEGSGERPVNEIEAPGHRLSS